MKTKKTRRTKKKTSPASATVINLSKVRESRRTDERRRVRRTMLKDFVQTFFTHHQGDKLFPVELIDASAEGCSFKVRYDADMETNDRFQGPLSLRLYLSRDTYIVVGVDVINSTPLVEDGGKYVRFGCRVDRSFSSYTAYRQLLQFIDALGAVSKFEPLAMGA